MSFDERVQCMKFQSFCSFFFFQAEDGIRDVERSRGLGDVYKRQEYMGTAMKTISQMLQNNYRARLYKQYVLNTPFLIKGIWTVVKGFLEDFTVAKVNVLGGDFSEMYTLIDKSQLEKKHGGDCEDITEDYFPPQIPQLSLIHI
eukprot:TRINITY_DN20992_c0_g2_i1.p2 TRINITY_DN20992_c0_g2~~TRINITY_DN20992_c0_g2_i1.p2  ORF type:complete len:144 (+),score=25.40 TRINITY_DN20992_c0_g2_i1:7-438(+)